MVARIGAYKIRDPEGVCKAERQLEVIDNKKLVLKHELEDINNRTAYLRIIMSQLSTTCKSFILDCQKNNQAILHDS